MNDQSWCKPHNEGKGSWVASSGMCHRKNKAGEVVEEACCKQCRLLQCRNRYKNRTPEMIAKNKAYQQKQTSKRRVDKKTHLRNTTYLGYVVWVFQHKTRFGPSQVQVVLSDGSLVTAYANLLDKTGKVLIGDGEIVRVKLKLCKGSKETRLLYFAKQAASFDTTAEGVQTIQRLFDLGWEIQKKQMNLNPNTARIFPAFPNVDKQSRLDENEEMCYDD